MKDPYTTYRENCPYFKANGVHRVVKGHNTCCNDDNVSVNHPVQPKTQVEMWREEIKENDVAIMKHCCNRLSLEGYKCPLKGTDNCFERRKKVWQLYDLISQTTQPIHPRYPSCTPTGSVEDRYATPDPNCNGMHPEGTRCPMEKIDIKTLGIQVREYRNGEAYTSEINPMKACRQIAEKVNEIIETLNKN